MIHSPRHLSVLLALFAGLAFAAGCGTQPSAGNDGGGVFQTDGGGHGGGTDGGVTDGGGGGGQNDGGVPDGGTTDGGGGGGGGGGTDGGTCHTPAAQDIGPGVTISGDPGAAPMGFADPSLLYPAGASAGYMTYTAVAPDAQATRIATSTDHGATWTYVGKVNAATTVTISTTDTSVCGASTCAGHWVHAASTIIDDPTDPDPSRRYKVFADSYFVASATHLSRYEIGSIDLWTTGSISAGANWQETRLLGWESSSAQSSTGVAVDVTRDPVLSPLLGFCSALTEPGALVHNGEIDLVLGCINGAGGDVVPIDISMIRSTDHGRTWSPVGTVLYHNDMGGIGPLGPQVSGGDIFDAGGATYLLASTNGSVDYFGSREPGYDGCALFKFADFTRGTLVGCGHGPQEIDRFNDRGFRYNGGCTYAPGASAAGLMGDVAAGTGSTSAFQVFATGKALP